MEKRVAKAKGMFNPKQVRWERDTLGFHYVTSCGVLCWS